MFEIEKKIIKLGYKYIVGVDEAGRGPLAGPVLSAAISLDSEIFFQTVKNFKNKISDSKKLTSLSREKAYKEIIKKLKVGIGLVEPAIIDKINILEATKLSMVLAINDLKKRYTYDKKKSCILVDGNVNVKFQAKSVNIEKGDNLCFSIGCASIVAKVVRDEIMQAYDFIYPEYGFCEHKGYGTKKHITMLKKFGIVPIHRKSFSPCKKYQ